MAAGLGELAVKNHVLGELFRPGELDHLRPEIVRGDSDVMRIVGQSPQAEYVRTGARRGGELRIGMGEEFSLDGAQPRRSISSQSCIS